MSLHCKIVSMGFVHLHVHSYFSFYDGTAGVEDLVRKAKEFGMKALALTDYNGVYGAVRFIRAARDAGIRPIVGAEVTVEGIGRLVLLVRSAEGYSNLCRILSHALLEDPHNPIVKQESLAKNPKDLFCLLGSPLWELLKGGRKSEAERILGTCLDIFGKECLLIELQNHDLPGDTERLEALWDFSRSHGILPVATNKVHFLNPEDYPVHKALISAARTVHHRDVSPKGNREFYLKSEREMSLLFKGYEDGLRNTEIIAQECNLALPSELVRPPEIPGKVPAREYLRKVCHERLETLFKENRQPLMRLDYELKVIEGKGFSEYFLVVADLVEFARSRGIRHSCRGSGSGSLVAYLLGITGVDPVENGLLFERFLNPERVDIPDIDIDLDSRRRDEVIGYAMERYRGQAAMVATVSRFRGRSAVREMGHAVGFSYERLDEILRPFGYYIPASRIREAMETLPELRGSELASDEFKGLLDTCSRIDDLPRLISVHLGGVVISREPLHHYSPMQRTHKGWPLLSFDKDDIEELGLIKTDLLGLRMLSAIEEAVTLIREQGKLIDLDRLDLTDRKVYELLRSGITLGCFQVESPGMRGLLGQLLPERFSDIVAAISLFRPGPVQADMVGRYMARRHGAEPVFYPHEAVRPILEETYGVVVFQEQVLRIAHEVAGFSYGKADLMRRAMANPGSEEMKGFREDFLAGAREKGIEKRVAQEIFSQIQTLAAFGFNKAHACSFARIVFQSVYLKAYHPAEFMTGVLNSLPGMYPERVLLHDAGRLGVRVLPPDVSRSGSGYTLEDGAIRVGLRGIRNIGPSGLARILEERSKRPFKDMEDFLKRVRPRKNILRSMILAGAFDPLNPSRKSLLRSALKERVEGAEDFTIMERVSFELENIGLDLSAHAISLFRDRLDRMGVVRSIHLKECRDEERVSVAGIKVVLHTPPTRTGIRVVFVTLEDETGLSDAVVFPDVQELYGAILFRSDLLIIEGPVRRVGKSVSVNAERIEALR